MEASIPDQRGLDRGEANAWIQICPVGPFHHVQRFFSSSEVTRPEVKPPGSFDNFQTQPLQAREDRNLERKQHDEHEREDTFKRTAQVIESYSRPVDPKRTIGSQPHNDGFGRINTDRRTCRTGASSPEPHLPVRVIMKITRSTSRISIHGTTFTSATSPRLLAERQDPRVTSHHFHRRGATPLTKKTLVD